MALESLHPSLRRVVLAIWGATFVWLVFFYGPSQFMQLNADLGWPVWRTRPTQALGGLLIVGGVGVMLYCTGLFARVGRGTPVPAAPPENLVIRGLYRYSRNPIYVADVAVWFGIFLLEGHAALLLYAVIATILVELAILLWEEPVLVRRFGSEYDSYLSGRPTLASAAEVMNSTVVQKNTSTSSGMEELMRLVSIVLSVLIAAVGAAGLASPEVIAALADYLRAPAARYVAAAGRLAFGVALYFAAPASRAPTVLHVFALVLIASGLATPVLGVDGYRTLVDWKLGSLHHVWAISALLFGGTLTYMLAKKADG